MLWREVAERLAPAEAMSNVTVGSGLDFWRGRLALLLGEEGEAERHFRAKLDQAEGHDLRLEECLAHLGLGDLAVRRSDPQTALDHLDRCIDIGTEIGAKLLVDEALSKRLDILGLAAVDLTTSIDAVAASLEAERPDLTPQAAPDGTVTLLFSDIENSTARTAELGDGKWMELLREHNSIVREALSAHGGYEVKSMGDGFMLAFGSAVDGLRCAIGMQRAFAERDAQADETLRVRIGLHTGEAIREADDFFGSHVNLAARVGGAATGDEILVSSLLKALTESAGEFRFDAGREVELKGISSSQRVHAVAWR